ncbi:MAG: DegT/DnrJ/EryC1/StrS family aminotransferase [Chloroflexi bacterium]|nr:DegT/DnrJ/EryC1/StrS family aminotransferase [Chloroflexota bacterium]
MSVPITKPSLTEEEAQAPLESIRSGWVTQGPKVVEFEKAIANYVGAAEGIATSSCTTALHMALVGLGVGAGDEVIVPSFSFIASANVILYTGATVVFADIDPRTYNVDPADVERKVTSRTKAILPVDQIGLTCDMDAINQIARDRGLVVVEDAAPTIGEKYKGRMVGANAEAVCFSFHPRKVITTGEGGMIMTNDSALATRLRTLRQHGMNVSDLARHNADRVIIEEYKELGFNYRMTDIQASIGIVQVRRLPELLRQRRERAARYNAELPRIRGISIPFVPKYAEHTYQSYCVRLTAECRLDREELMTNLLRRGIATRRGVMASHLEDVYVKRYGKVHLPVTEEATRTTMLIPLYASMTDDEQSYVIDALREELGAA